MKNRSLLTACVGIVACGLFLTASPSHAGVDIDFGASIQLNDDMDLYLSISSHYFDRDRRVIDRCAGRYHDPDDLAVALFLSHYSGRSTDRVWRLRQKGLTWWEISLRLGVPAEVWFVSVPRDPGPPYGNAYGHWKHHKTDRHHAVVITDVDARNLVAVRMLHEYYGVPAERAMEWRSSGSDLRTLMSREYRERHVRPDPSRTAMSHDSKPGNGPGNGHGNGHGKGHDKSRNH